MLTRIASLTLLILMLAVTGPAPASSAVVPFDAKAFAQAREEGRSLVVFVHAPW